jgi:retinol dehydrogenase 12
MSSIRKFPMPSSSSQLKRMVYSVLLQKSFNPVCPPTDLTGQVFVVTGGASGLGLGVSRGLVMRGAVVVMTGRNEAVGDAVARQLCASRPDAAKFLALDLADLTRCRPFIGKLTEFVGTRKISGLVANAGVWPEKHEQSPQGFEIAFATNVLGHHLLFHEMQAAHLFVECARIVITTGDIYILSSGDPAEDFVAPDNDLQQYYCRSKLANLWQTAHLQAQFPQHEFVAVHPGVVATGLVAGSRFVSLLKSMMFLGIEDGAQSQLLCATQPVDRGGYFHNTCGWVELDATDTAKDTQKGQTLMAKCDRLIEPFL